MRTRNNTPIETRDRMAKESSARMTQKWQLMTLNEQAQVIQRLTDGAAEMSTEKRRLALQKRWATKSPSERRSNVEAALRVAKVAWQDWWTGLTSEERVAISKKLHRDMLSNRDRDEWSRIAKEVWAAKTDEEQQRALVAMNAREKNPTPPR